MITGQLICGPFGPPVLPPDYWRNGWDVKDRELMRVIYEIRMRKLPPARARNPKARLRTAKGKKA